MKPKKPTIPSYRWVGERLPPWKRSIDLGDLSYEYAEEEETLFNSSWHGNDPDSAASSTEAGYIAGH